MVDAELAQEPERIWAEFDDPDDPDQRFRCDLTWLTSAYRCIFGQGCRGIDADLPDAGCCVLGAHFTDVDDVERVTAIVDDLGDDEWQYRDIGLAQGWTRDEDGETATRVVDGACILLNRPGFPAGAGCALHQAAQARGLAPAATKPDVCWQLPLRRTYRHVTDADGTTYLETSIGEYRRGDWGPGGHDFDWYCTNSPLAHGAGESSPTPLFRGSETELRALMGDAGYARLVDACEAHLAGVAAVRADAGGRRLLPLLVHPATRAAQPDVG